jgi:glycosyltransferase involved in cell wall biosynthesis
MISCGGIGTVIKNLIPALSSPPFETHLISNNLPIYSLKEQFAIPRLVPKTDLFWSPHYNVPLLPLKAKKRIVTIHDAYHLAFKKTLHWKKRLYAETLFRQAISRSDLILTVSEFSRQELCRLLSLPEHKIQVIYSGVDAAHFSKKVSSESKEALRKKYSLPPSFFLFVGNVKPHKNLQLILAAYEQFSIDLPLVIVGKVEISKANKIFVAEGVSDEELPAFYQMALALLFPSLYEGFGLPPLEAMAAGCPVIASNAASLPEICGRAALLIDPTKVDDLGAAMQRMIEDEPLKNALREKGKAHVQKFPWETCARQYRKVFEEIHFG